MPNRIIKESICTSDNLDGLSWFEEVFFYRLIVHCDDFGRMDARPAILRSRLFPLKTVTDKQIIAAVQSLRSADIIDLYEVDGRSYLQMRKWDNHQQVRAKKSKFPSPDEGCYQLISGDSKCPRNPIQSESNPNPIRSESNTRAKKAYGEFKNVLLTDAELEKLKKEHENTDEAIEFLSRYIERKGYKAKSHYLCIVDWVFKALDERKGKEPCENMGGSFETDDFFEAALKRSYE